MSYAKFRARVLHGGRYALAAPDQTPADFEFTPTLGVDPLSTVNSNTVTISGLGAGVAAAMTITGGQYKKNAGSADSAATTVVNGDTVQLVATSANDYETLSSVTLTVGTFTATWNITTGELVLGDVVSTQAEFVAAMALHGTDGNATIVIAEDNTIDPGYVFTEAPTAKLTIRGPTNAAVAPFKYWSFANTARNITVMWVDGGDSEATSGDLIGGPSSGYATNIEILGCHLYGKYFDPQGNYDAPLPQPTTLRIVNGRYDGYIFKGNYCHDFCNGSRPLEAKGAIDVSDNVFVRYYEDAIHNGVSASGVTYRCANNLIAICWSTLDDTGSPTGGPPHSDAIQLDLNNDVTLDGGSIVGNVIIDGDPANPPRGKAHHILVKGAGGTHQRLRIGDTLHCTLDSAAHAPDASYGSNAVMYRNRVPRLVPGQGSGTSIAALVGLAGVADPLPNMVCDSVCEQISVAGDDYSRGNLRVVNGDALYSMADPNRLYVGPYPTSLNFDTLADCLASKAAVVAAYEYNPTGPMGHLAGAYDYVAGEETGAVQVRPFVGLKSFENVPNSGASTTGLMPVVGGGVGIALTVPTGVEWRKASDITGTGATTWTSDPGTIDEGEWLQLRRDNPGTRNTSVEIGVTLDGEEYSKLITTAPAATIVRVANNSSARSLITPNVASAAGMKKLVLAKRVKGNTNTFDCYLAQGTTGAAFKSQIVSSGERNQIVSTSAGQMTSLRAKDDLDYLDVIVWDFTKASATEGALWYRNRQLHDYVVNSWGGTGISFDPATILASLGVFAEGDGGNLMASGVMGDWLIDWGDADYVIPDFSDPANIAKFNPDTLGADGSGFLGHQPKLFFPADVSAWQGTVANAGTEAVSMVKQAGTYTLAA